MSLSLPNHLGLAETRHGQMLHFVGDPLMGECLRRYGEWSEEEVRLFQQIVRPGDVAVEGGANIGAHSLALAKLVGRGALYAFEPQPAVFQVLCANLALNGLHGVRAVHAGLGERQGMLYIPPIDYAAPGVNIGGVALNADGGEPVRIVTIDSLNLPSVRLIKLDVEGMELNALMGAEQTLRRCRPILYVEADRRELRPALLGFIKAHGYRLWRHDPPYFNPDNWRGETCNVVEGYVSRNVLAIPAELSCSVPTLTELEA